MPPRVKIRGIYTTALTKLLLDQQCFIVDPSARICQRFGLAADEIGHDVEVRDRDDLQGIEALGEAERITHFITLLQEHLTDATLMQIEPLEKPENLVRAVIEFPSESKHLLDAARASICPTLLRHHRLRIIDSQRLETFESALMKRPENKTEIERQCFREMILLPIEKRGAFKLEHIRPAGKPIRAREGVILKADERRMVFKRSFAEGRYDGLDMPIEKGDYGLTDIREGAWYVRHSYFSKDKKLKGEYYNINTPVEFYPYGGRYLDLEVDVIRRVGEKPAMIDVEKLSFLVQDGRISEALKTKALAVAEELMASLRP